MKKMTSYTRFAAVVLSAIITNSDGRVTGVHRRLIQKKTFPCKLTDQSDFNK